MIGKVLHGEVRSCEPAFNLSLHHTVASSQNVLFENVRFGAT